MSDKKRGLGRSLNDILPPGNWLKRDDIQLFYCPVEQLTPNPYQPRQVFDDGQLDELIQSIREKGVLQPILVTRTQEANQYRIIAGERRWKASKAAGLTEVPVILRDSTSAEALELALIENIQRRDLNCLEEALAYLRLQEEFSLTQEEIARRVGKNRSTVANLIRLLQLPQDIRADVLNEKLSMGHARAILSLPGPDAQRKLRDLILARGLSVRQAEQYAAKSHEPKEQHPDPDPALKQIQSSLQSHFGSKVLLRRRGRRGTITLPFSSDEEFQSLLLRMGLLPAEADRED